MIIDVIDMEDPVLGSNRAQWLRYLGARSVRIELYGMCNGVGQMIQEITDRAAGRRLGCAAGLVARRLGWAECQRRPRGGGLSRCPLDRSFGSEHRRAARHAG